MPEYLGTRVRGRETKTLNRVVYMPEIEGGRGEPGKPDAYIGLEFVG